MRRNFLVAMLVGTGLFLFACCVAAAGGQATRSNAPAGAEARVALVDIAHIFKKYDKFNRLKEEMQADVKARETEIAAAQAELKQLLTKKQQFTPDTPTYKDIDQKIVRQKTELELLNDNSRREFTQREARIYHQVYQEVEAEIRRYAESNGITLVLRFSRDEDGATPNPQDVIKEVSQQVIYSLPHMDITDVILEKLNGKQRVTGSGGKPASSGKPAHEETKGTRTGNKQDQNKPSGGAIKK